MGPIGYAETMPTNGFLKDGLVPVSLRKFGEALQPQRRPVGHTRARRTFSLQGVQDNPQWTPLILGSKRLWFTLCALCAELHYGIYINKLKQLLEGVVNNTIKISNRLSYELCQQTWMVAVQTCMASDYLLASQGGMCAILGQESCTYISDGFEAQQTGIILIERAVED